MTPERTDLTEGLLGHWRGGRSPDGRVRDRSPDGNHGEYGFDARWIWFTNPRAVRHVGERDRTYVGYLGGPTGADIQVGAYDHDAGTFDRTTLDASFSADDHTNPSLFVRRDGRLLVFWTGHNGDRIVYRIAERPESVDSFEPPRTIDGQDVTYPNPVRPDPEGPLYLFYRERRVTSDATDDKYGYMGDGNVYYRTSTDGGFTWSDATRFVTAPEGHYSMYFVPAVGAGGVHFFFTDAERGGDAPKWNVMYCRFRDGAVSRADGTTILDEGDLPLSKGDLEVVYDSTAPDGHHAWVWDAAVDADGNPAVVYATFPSTLAHTYRYARWDGERWHDHHLLDAGGHVEAAGVELHYSAGVALADDPTVAYACVARDGYRGVERLKTETHGRTWASEPVARRPAGTPLRPVAPENAADEMPVLWLAGSYPNMHASQTVLRGLPTDAIEAPHLVGDGERGVDLGLDLYGARAFREGLSVSALVRTDDPDHPQTIADFGGAIQLGIARETAGFEIALAGEEESTAVAWDGGVAGDWYCVEGKWDGERLALLVDGDRVATASFAGPLAFDDSRTGWTLLKGDGLTADGLRGAICDVRLYNRPTTTAESERLAERTR